MHKKARKQHPGGTTCQRQDLQVLNHPEIQMRNTRSHSHIEKDDDKQTDEVTASPGLPDIHAKFRKMRSSVKRRTSSKVLAPCHQNPGSSESPIITSDMDSNDEQHTSLVFPCTRTLPIAQNNGSPDKTSVLTLSPVFNTTRLTLTRVTRPTRTNDLERPPKKTCSNDVSTVQQTASPVVKTRLNNATGDSKHPPRMRSRSRTSAACPDNPGSTQAPIIIDSMPDKHCHVHTCEPIPTHPKTPVTRQRKRFLGLQTPVHSKLENARVLVKDTPQEEYGVPVRLRQTAHRLPLCPAVGYDVSSCSN